MLCVITPFTTEGRSYRKTYALLILLGMSFVSTAVFVKALYDQSTVAELNSTHVYAYLDFLLIALAFTIKTPVYPFSI